MKKITYVLLAFIALFVNSTAYAVEARVPATSIGQALQSARGKDNFSEIKSARFDVKKKTYNITYLTKEGKIETVKISKINVKEVK